MGAGFVWLDRSKCGSERIGREEEGASSGRAEMGAYAAILRRAPDNEDLVTATDSEVLCRLVGRWVGQGGKASLGRAMEKEGENYRWQERAKRVVYPYYDRNLGQWKKGTWTKTIRNAARRGAAESLMEEQLQFGANKWRKGLFEERSEDTDGDQSMGDQT
jgi:hypothetical protein